MKCLRKSGLGLSTAHSTHCLVDCLADYPATKNYVSAMLFKGILLVGLITSDSGETTRFVTDLIIFRTPESLCVGVLHI